MKLITASLLVLTCACSPTKTSDVNAGWSGDSSVRAPQGETGVRVVGHVLDRGTGEAVVGARIEAPGGRTAVSDANGYFEITGFVEGESGELTASWGKEHTARTQLRALQAGQLEVVLHLGK